MIRIGVVTTMASRCVQLLGVFIDRHLDMKKQVLQMISACSFYLRNINQISRFLPRPLSHHGLTTVTRSYTARLHLTSPVYSEYITQLPG